MTDLDRAELRRRAESAAGSLPPKQRERGTQAGVSVGHRDLLTLLDALDEAEKERGKAIAEVARQQALRVENGKRFEQMRSERTAALARAEAAEAKLANVSGFVDGLMGDETNTVAVSVGRGLRAALAPVTEEGDKDGRQNATHQE